MVTGSSNVGSVIGSLFWVIDGEAISQTMESSYFRLSTTFRVLKRVCIDVITSEKIMHYYNYMILIIDKPRTNSEYFINSDICLFVS